MASYVMWFMLFGSVGGGFIDSATEMNDGAPFPGDQRASSKLRSDRVNRYLL